MAIVPTPRGPLRLAHRGDWRRAPENTIPALTAALEIAGCDGLEFDVRASADGVPVLLHDETLERVQGRPDRVDALTAELWDDPEALAKAQSQVRRELLRDAVSEAVLPASPRRAAQFVEEGTL